jgi:hypothetical protein
VKHGIAAKSPRKQEEKGMREVARAAQEVTDSTQRLIAKLGATICTSTCRART